MNTLIEILTETVDTLGAYLCVPKASLAMPKNGIHCRDLIDSLFLYRLNELSPKTMLEHKADELFDNVFSQSFSRYRDDIDVLKAGLAIQSFFSYNLCDGDEEEILRDFDDKIFVAIQQAKLVLNSEIFDILYLSLFYVSKRVAQMQEFGVCNKVMLRLFHEVLNLIYYLGTHVDVPSDYMRCSNAFDMDNKYLMLFEALTFASSLGIGYEKIAITIETMARQISAVNLDNDICKIYQTLVINYANETLQNAKLHKISSSLANGINITRALETLDFEMLLDYRRGAISQIVILSEYLFSSGDFNIYSDAIVECARMANFKISEELCALNSHTKQKSDKDISCIGLLLIRFLENRKHNIIA